MDLDAIKNLLKHREPFLFVTTVENIFENEIKTSLEITKGEFFFKGHFPGEPVMPGVLLIETIGQSANILIVHNLAKEKNCLPKDIRYDSFLAKVNSVKFKAKIIPPAVLYIKVKINPLSENFYEVIGHIFVDNELKVIGNLTTYFKYRE